MAARPFILALAVTLSGCGPPLVWGKDEAIKSRLLKIVPRGATVARLDAEAKSRGWRISKRDDRSFGKDVDHYFGGGCRYEGGQSEYIVVAEYGLLTTTVETVWLFDEVGKLGDVCVRRTTDAP